MDGQTVTTNAVGVYRVFKNWGATVVYTAIEDYCFEDCSTRKTLNLDTTVSPAVIDASETKLNPALYAIAISDGKAYASAQAAVDATDGDMVTLVNDSTETVTLATDKYIGLDFNGHTLDKLVVTAGTVDIYAGSSGTLTSARVSQPGKVRCLKNDVVAAPTGYEWFNDDGGTFWMLVKKTEPYTGDVTIATNLTADATWVMTLENANITVDKVAGTETLASITNNLTAIQGTGKILLNAAGDAAKAYRDALRSLRTEESEKTVTIDCLSVEPKDDGKGGLEAIVDKDAEEKDAETTVVGAMKTDGDVLIQVMDDATKDVVVNEGAETSKDMTIINESTTQSLTVPEAKAENVTIKNYGHLESDTTADNNLIITNSSANTLVGTYKAGGNIEVTGQYGSLSNVTFDAEGTLTLKRRNIISGPVTLKADEIDVHANWLFFSVQNNNTTLSIDFDQVKDSMVFYVLIDDNMASGNYPLAMNATAAATKTFGLKNAVNSPAFNMTVGGSNNPIYNGGSYAVVLDEGALKLTVDADYVAEALATLASKTNTATATIDALRILTSDKNASKGILGSIAFVQETVINDAKDTDAIGKAISEAESLIGQVVDAAKTVEASMPTDITIDANAAQDGTNTFNTLDAAFKAELTPCATNLVLTGGIVSLSSDVPADASPDGATNSLQVITGSGYLLIDENHVNAAGANDAAALAAALDALVAEDSTVKVRTAANSYVGNDEDVFSEDVAAFESIKLTTPWISGDVELIAPTTTITGTLAWDFLDPMSSPVTLENFDDITSVDADYAIELGMDITTNTYTLATKASKLEGQNFTFRTNRTAYAELTVGQDGDVVYNGMVYTLAMEGTSLTMMVDGDYVPEQLAAVRGPVDAAIAQVNAMRLTPSEKATAIDALNQIYSDVTTGVDAAKNKAGVAAAIASVGVEGAIAGVLAGAEALEATKPGDITIDATVASDGTNTFTSLNEAFNNTEFMPCATNLVLTGRTVGLSAGVFAAPATNCLTMISGTGTIVIDKNHKDEDGNDDAAALESFFKTIAGESIKVTTGDQVVIATDMTPAGEVVAVESISLGGTTTISTNVVFTAPAVANNGTLKWDLTGDNHEATLADFDYIAEAAGAKFQIALDDDQATGGTITNYVIATGAASATNRVFWLDGVTPETNLTVTAGTIYVGAKAFTLTVDDAGNLVFDIAWGKFAITFDAMGGTCTNGCETLTYDCKVNDGYTLPGKATREDYTFLGWYASWTNNAAKVSDGQDFVKLAEHTIYAQWAPDPSNPSTTKALSEFLDDGTPRYEIETNSFKNASIASLVTPLYLRDIRYGAFMYCKSLKTVRLTQPRDYASPTNVPLHVETYAFAGSGVRSIVIPAGAVIDNYAFAACQYVTNITFLGTCTILGDNPFRQCGTVNDVSNHVVTVSLAPAAWVDEDFRQTLETKIANLTFVKLETDEVAGYLENGAPSVEGDQLSVPFTTNLDAMHAYVSALVKKDAADPWQAVSADSVEKTGADAYRATFTLPGAWSLCILKLSVIE